MLDLAKQPIIYVTRDLERALGLPLNTKGYFIISNFTDFGNQIAGGRKNILLIKSKQILDTWKLLQHPKAKHFINKQKSPQILVFKNTLQIEKTCAENNWRLLNPPAKISNEVEEKISQIAWLALSETDGLDLTKYLPKYQVLKCREVKYKNKSFILQFNRSHTGSGTVLIENEKQLQALQQKFPEREVRIAEYISGPLFTNNNVVTKKEILLGNINYQITGLKPFTDLPFSTIGNDWSLPHKILNKKQITEYKKIATDVGLKLQKVGWKGLFGIDVVQNERTKKLYLLEINCRQPASTTYESQLQSKVKSPSSSTDRQKSKITTFEAHLLALLGENLKNFKLTKIKNGAQIIQRVTTYTPSAKIPKFYKKPFFKFIFYNNEKYNADLIRLQTNFGIMAEHNKLNDYGTILQYFVRGAKEGKPWCAPRATGIIIRDNQILLMKRNRYGVKYFILPGGTVEPKEKMGNTVLREIKEETNLVCTLKKTRPLIYQNHLDGKKDYNFFIDECHGKAELPKNSEEATRNMEGNTYEPVWVEIKNLKTIDLQPKEIKNKLIKILEIK